MRVLSKVHEEPNYPAKTHGLLVVFFYTGNSPSYSFMVDNFLTK